MILSTTTPAFAVKAPVGANVPVVVILPGSAMLSTILSAVTALSAILAVVTLASTSLAVVIVSSTGTLIFV